MTDSILANFPAMTVLNPAAVVGGVDIQLDDDKGYCRVSTQLVTLKCFPRDKYEYIRNFYFGYADGKYFCNPCAAVLSDGPSAHKVTYGIELNKPICIEGQMFILRQAANKNITLEVI